MAHLYSAKNLLFITGKRRNHPFYNAIRKYGDKAFYLTGAFYVFGGQRDLDQAEIDIIARFKSQIPNGYNLMSGGFGGKHSTKTKRKIGLLGIGRPGTMLGKKHSIETRRKMSASHAGRVRGPSPLRGRKRGPMSQENRDRISVAKLGRKIKPFSDSHRQNMSKSQSKAQLKRRQREKQEKYK